VRKNEGLNDHNNHGRLDSTRRIVKVEIPVASMSSDYTIQKYWSCRKESDDGDGGDVLLSWVFSPNGSSSMIVPSTGSPLEMDGWMDGWRASRASYVPRVEAGALYKVARARQKRFAIRFRTPDDKRNPKQARGIGMASSPQLFDILFAPGTLNE
jgi:hypothetical protein